MLHLLHILRRSPRFALMLAGVMIMWILAWQLGIKKTVSLLSQYASITGTAELQREQTTHPEELLKHLEHLDREMGCSDIPGDDIRQAILERLSQSGRICPFSMVDIPEGYCYLKQDYTVMINTFVMSGDYPDLLRLIYGLDTTDAPGRLIAARMFVHKIYQAARPELRLALYFQNLKKEHEAH